MIAAILATVAGRKWEIGVMIVLCAAALLLWHADRRSQYALGAADTKAEFERIINASKDLIGNEKQAALDAASAAARRVCVEQGLPPSDCEDL